MIDNVSDIAVFYDVNPNGAHDSGVRRTPLRKYGSNLIFR